MFKQIIFKRRINIIVITLITLFSILFPYIVTMANMEKTDLQLYNPKPYGKYVIISNNGENIKMDVEMFIPLVLYSIMPEKYEEETMKAMAVIIRTYIIYRINEQSSRHSNTQNTEQDNIQGDVTGNNTAEDLSDSQSGSNTSIENDSIRIEQLGLPYTTYSELEKKWGKKYEIKYNNTMKLIEETNGEAIYYSGEPIYPYYHQISAGMTNPGEYDYLKSVESKQDIASENYMNVLYFTPDNIIEKLQTKVNTDLSADTLTEIISVNMKENSEYVDSINVGNEQISVDEWQNIFRIPSQAFTFEQFSDGFKIVSKGNGCGKGLSVYGADKMAEEGRNYKEILTYYYTGVDIHD